MWIYIVIAVIVIIVLYALITYNNFIKLKNMVKEAFATMDVYLKKRWDLIPNIVETVKGYAKHEENTLKEVVELRNSSYDSMSDDEKVKANQRISKDINKIMLLAERIGLHTVKHGLIKTQNNGYLYISKRIDRKNDQKLAMEDFCQLSNKLTEYKYQGSYERCVKEVIDKFSSRKVIDKISFFNCIYFSYLVGNTDMHLKNFSLFDDGSGYHLASFYDLVSSLILVGQEEMALAINGKRKHLTKNDFISFGVSSGLTKELTIKLMDNINKKLKEVYESEIDRSLISEKFKEELKDLIKKRIASLI